MNVLFITLDQFRGDCLGAGGHPLVRTPALDALAAAGSAAGQPLQPGCAVRTRPGVPVHGHLPDEQPGGRQRHPAGRALRQRGQGGAAGRLRSRRCSATPIRASIPARPPGATTRGCSTTRACCRASRRCCTSPTTIRCGSTGWRTKGYTDLSDGYTELAREPPPARRAQRVGVPHRSRARLAAATGPGHAVVRAPELPATAPAAHRGRRVRDHVRPGRRRAADPTTRSPAPLPRGGDASTRFVGTRRTRARLRRMRAQYYGMISEVDHQLARLWDALRDPADVGRHDDRRHGRSRRSARRPRAGPASSGTSSRATTSSASSGTHTTRRRTARWSTRSPRTSTCSRPSATSSA